jgi:DNA gyrase subunit B
MSAETMTIINQDDVRPNDSYGAASIKILKGLEAVRKRPGMYIGDTGVRGLHHCLWEIIDNSVDESVAGYCTKIKVTLHKDHSATVIDNGRGIPVDLHPEEGVSSATLAVTLLHAGGKFGGDDSAYSRSGGLHGVGASVVNALSTRFDMRIWRQAKVWEQSFLDGGTPVADLVAVGDTDINKTGTEITFWPDETIFCALEDDGDGTDVRHMVYRFDQTKVAERIELLSYLNPGLELTFIDERTPEVFEKTWCAESFLGFIDFIAKGKDLGEPLLEGMAFEKNVEPSKGSNTKSVYVRIALRPNTGSKSEVLSFVNNIYTPGGGTHLTGFKTALLRSINQYASENNLLKAPLTGEDVAEGLAAAILVRVDEPKFEGQTKDKLGSREAQGAVNAALYQYLSKFFEENPKQAKDWVLRCQRASKAREAADRARDQVNGESRASSGFRLPGKLADCQEKDPRLTEIYFVEGDSAGGSAKQGRDRKTQAILPLKGKILNTHRALSEDVLKNIEVQNVIMALGCGIGENFDLAKLRYHKIVIMTDADVDGAHICTLILTLFHNYMPQLIEAGYVYVAMPPLYKVKTSKKSHYIKDEEELTEFFTTHDRKAWDLQRFKGLGEMNPEQLWETTMNPDNRILGQVEYHGTDAEEDEVFEILMGEDVPPRRAFIEENANLASVQI